MVINGKDWKKIKDEEKISLCKELIDEGKKAKLGNEIEWYLNYMFLEGNHYAKFNTTTNSLETEDRSKSEVRMVINKVKSSVRAVRNYVTREEPKWEILPGDTDKETIDNARRVSKVMDYIYRQLHLEQLIDGLADSVLNTSIGWVEIDWDEKGARGLGQVRVRLHDSFDIIHDPHGEIQEGRFVGRYIGKSIRRTLDEIHLDKRYNEKARKRVEADTELAESPIKARIIRREMSGTAGEESPIKRAAVRELLLWNEDPQEGESQLQLFTFAGNEVLRDEPTEFEEYPYYPMQVSMNPKKVLQRSWTADAVPINKALDRVISQKIMFVNQALVFRILMEKGAYGGRISNEGAEIIEVNRGKTFQTMPLPNLPPDMDQLIEQLNVFIEDVLSAHEASYGRMPAGARSGKTLEALQAAEANSLSGLSRSLRSFLEVIGGRILEIIADKYVTSRIVKIADPEEAGEGTPEQKQYLKIIGEGAIEEGEKPPDGATIIHKDNELIVSLGSWLGHTKEAQRETLLKLGEIGVLPSDEILRQFEFPNIEALSQKAKEERLEQHELDADIAGRRGEGGEIPAGGQPGADKLLALADKENMQMMNGEQVPSTEGADMNHTQAHVDFTKTKMFVAISPQIQEFFNQHIQGEVDDQQLFI